MIPIKSAREVEKMRQACRTASDILDRVSDLVRPGISTKEIDEAAAVFMQEECVRSAFLGYRLGHRVFPGNICISLNDEVVHGIASQRRVQYGRFAFRVGSTSSALHRAPTQSPPCRCPC